MAPSGKSLKKISSLGVQCVPIRLNRTSGLIPKDLSSIIRLCRIYREVRPDIVHHFTLKCILYGMIAAFFARVPRKINAFTGMGAAFTGTSLGIVLLKGAIKALIKLLFCAPNVDVVVQNPSDREEVLAYKFIHPQRLHLIPGSGVDTTKFIPIDGQKFPQKRVLMVSRLLVDKGVREYVATARVVTERRMDVEFLLAGDIDEGNPTSVPLDEVTQWQKIDRFFVLGHQEGMVALLNSCDIVVLPSYREGLPLSLLEAASCELPIVTTDVPGCRDVVIDGENGLLVPKKNVDELITAIERLVDDQSLRQKMGKAGRRIVEEKFEHKVILEKTLALYCEEQNDCSG